MEKPLLDRITAKPSSLDPTNIDEDQELLKAGFAYVTERNGIKLYRRPKIFAKYMDKR